MSQEIIDAVRDIEREKGIESGALVVALEDALLAAYKVTHQHEMVLLDRLLRGFREIPNLRLFGISDPARFDQRCSTVSIRIGDHHPTQIAKFLGDRGIFTWDGNYYALNLTEHLDVEKSGGFLRIGLVHYNTMEEVERLLVALKEIAG